jgi:hypothetical protein
MSLKQILANRRTGKSLLTGSDIPATTKSITITVVAIRESPAAFSAPAIIDFKPPINGKSAWAVNKTNMKLLIESHGEDEADLVGRKIALEVISVENPKTKEMVRSLRVVAKKKGKKKAA